MIMHSSGIKIPRNGFKVGGSSLFCFITETTSRSIIYMRRNAGLTMSASITSTVLQTALSQNVRTPLSLSTLTKKCGTTCHNTALAQQVCRAEAPLTGPKQSSISSSKTVVTKSSIQVAPTTITQCRQWITSPPPVSTGSILQMALSLLSGPRLTGSTSFLLILVRVSILMELSGRLGLGLYIPHSKNFKQPGKIANVNTQQTTNLET